MYDVGSKVVHPCHGAGTITRIQEKTIGASHHTYYIISTVCKSMQVMVPVRRAEDVGIRDVGDEQDLRSTLDFFFVPPGKDDIETDFRTRQNALQEQLKSGSFSDVAGAVRMLYYLNAQRPLGMTDRQMYDDGKQMLASELALASDQEIDGAMEEIENRLANVLEQDDED